MFPGCLSEKITIKILALGIIIGIILSVLIAASYQISGNARFCSSCHSMKLVASRWQLSQHKQFGCVECHLPDTHIAGQVFYKARVGINDLIHETLRTYPAEIRLSDKGQVIVNQNCLRCHVSTVENTAMVSNGANCLNCHRYIVRGRSADEGGIKVER